MQQLQDDQAKRQKEADDDYACHVTEMDKQCTQQAERHVEVQRRLHVSQTSAQSPTLYQFHSCPSVQVRALLPSFLQQLPPMLPPHVPVHAPPPPSQSKGPQLVPPPPHPLIPANVLPQVPVVDFAQQHIIAQIPLTRQVNEVARLEWDLRNSISDLEEAV